MNKKIIIAAIIILAAAMVTAAMVTATKRKTRTKFRTKTSTGGQQGVTMSSTDTETTTVPCIGGDCFYLV